MFCRIGLVVLSGWLLCGIGHADENEPLCLIRQGRKMGFINMRGEWVIKPSLIDSVVISLKD